MTLTAISLRQAASGRFFGLVATLLRWGEQRAWAIDPVNGNDGGDGTPEEPLATMAEFNSRMAALPVSVPQTLQCVGDVVDAPLQLVGTRYAFGAGLTVSGTRTALAAGTLTAVAGLGPSGIGPWQVDDTGSGIDFTTLPTGARLIFGNGNVAFIRNVVSATRIVIGNPASLVLLNQTPTVGQAYTVETLSRLLVPQVVASAIVAPTVAVNAIPPVVLQHVAFDSGLGWLGGNTCPVTVFGCEIRAADSNSQGVFEPGGQYQFRGCRFTHASGTGGPIFETSPRGVTLACCVIAGPSQNAGLQLQVLGGRVIFQGVCTWGAVVQALNAGTYVQLANFGLNVNNSGALAGLQITAGALVDATSSNAILAGNAGTGFGIDAQSGGYSFVGAALIPQITGGAGQTYRVGGTVYADNTALGVGQFAALLNAIPPTQANLVNTGTRGPGIAFISQR